MPSTANGAESNVPDTEAGAGESGAPSCDSYASLLTALFDGEASPAEAWAARAHLGQCVRCARMWFLWTRMRATLQSAPPPCVPAGLLARVLLACRLSLLHRALSQKSAPRRAASHHAPHDTPGIESTLMPSSLAEHALNAAPDKLETALGSWPAAMDAPAAPAHLREAILRRTVGIPARPAPTTSARSAPAPSAFAQFERTRHDFTARSIRASQRIARWAMPVAAPAMLVWMAMSTSHAPHFMASENVDDMSFLSSAAGENEMANSPSFTNEGERRGKKAGAGDTLRAPQPKSEARRNRQDEPRPGESVTDGAANNAAESDIGNPDDNVGESVASLQRANGRTSPPATFLSKTDTSGRMNTDARPRETERAVIFASGADARSKMRAQGVRLAITNTLPKSEDVARATQRGASSAPHRTSAMRISAPRMTPAFSVLPAPRATGVTSRAVAQHAGLLRASCRPVGKRIRLANDTENGWEFAARTAPGPAHKSGADSDAGEPDDESDDGAPSRDIMDEYRAALMDDGGDSDLPESS